MQPINWADGFFCCCLFSEFKIQIIIEQSLRNGYQNGRSWYPEGGTWKGDNLTVKSRSFGGYAIAVDTTAPKIVPINIYQNSDMRNKWSISVKINDNLSGINYYRGTVDGKWILMEYDAKNDLLTYFFDEKVPAGKHQFKLIVSDGVNNTSTFEADFIR